MGDGTFAAPTRFDLSSRLSAGLLVGDVTGDGRVDILEYEYVLVQNAPPAVPRGSISQPLSSQLDGNESTSKAHLDVNGDQSVSPLDVLLVINYLNNFVVVMPQSSNKLREDVNRDGFVSPLDVLVIINYLNARTEDSGSGEAAVAAPAVDLFFVEFENRSKRRNSNSYLFDPIDNSLMEKLIDDLVLFHETN